MDEAALERYREQALAVLEASPPRDATETRTLLVDPLLSALGWDVRGDHCRTDLTVADADVDYLLSVDSGASATPSTPALVVAVEPADGSLRRGRADRLQTAMGRTGVDRGLYTSGRQLLLLAGPSEEDRRAIDLVDLLDQRDALAHFGASDADRRLGRQTRQLAARRLVVERDDLIDEIVDPLTAVAGEPYRRELRTAADEFLGALVRSLASDDHDRVTGFDAAEPGATAGPPGDGSEISGSSGSVTDAGGGTDDSSQRVEQDEAGDETARKETESTDGRTPAHEEPPEEVSDGAEDGATIDPTSATGTIDDDGDGEYVVRFFADRGSVGAVGHSTPAGALVQTAEYCFERGLSGVRLPWSPGEDAEDADVVLNQEPVLADGSPMPAARQLSNGVYVNLGGDPETVATRVEAVAERAGFRAMLTGDWPAEDA